MTRSLVLVALLVAGSGAIAAASGCSQRSDDRATGSATTNASTAANATSASPSPARAAITTAMLPLNPSPLAPSHLVAGPGLDGATITETESCAGCHADAAAQWRTSAHAFGSFNNPAYRVVVDRFRKDVGKDASRFCAGCHDVALLVDGAMAADVAPNDGRAHGGITCRVCHGIDAVRPDGNGSFSVASTPIPIPRDGDAESVRLHKERMALAPLRTAQMCGGCHRAFLGAETGNVAHLIGQDDMTAWVRSGYAGNGSARVDSPFAKAECRNCHMPLEDAPRGDAAAKNGKIASHRFLGAHTWLQAMRGDADALARAKEMLRGAASIDVAVAVHADGSRTLPADGAPVKPGEAIVLDVVVRNQRVGHRFPGGTVDAQDVWIELVVRDAGGRVLADAGTQHDKGEDLTAHVMRASPVGDDGRPLLVRETEKFRTTAFDHTLGPRDAQVVRYRFDAPSTLTLPLSVTARLRHRSRNLTLQAATCANAKTPRGQQFSAAVAKRTGAPAPDPCILQPITEVAEATIALGGEIPAPDARAWQRLFDHALGMTKALQEQVDEARPSLERALALLPAAGADRARAMVMALYGAVAVREGRTDEAMKWLDGAEALAPKHAAIGRLRGEALTSVWRWTEAIAPLRASALAAPGDDAAWMRLAVAYGSAGDPAAAIEAAQRGLVLQPRDGDMLRVQSLSLDALHAPQSETDRARTAFLAFRPPDDAPQLRALCSDRVPGCALERIPVHVHPMRPAR